MRETLSVKMSLQDVMIKMSEGNPGGLRVLMDIIKRDPDKGIVTILHLDDMNIWGGQIWAGFKDHCDHDLEVFVKAIDSRDPEMVKTINDSAGLGDEEKAVTHGASFRR